MRVHGMNGFASTTAGTFLLLLPLLVGCAGDGTRAQPIETSSGSVHTADRWMATQPFKDQAEAGMLTMRSIQPSRFDNGTSRLNRLGRREIRVLATRYRTDPGTLSVARGGVDEEMYQRRVRAVMDELHANGVDTSRMILDEHVSGGQGMPSVEVIRIVQQGRTEKLRPEQGQVLGQVGGSEPVE